MPSRHVSLRIDEKTYERLLATSRRRKEPVSSLAKRLIDEGLRMEAHPGIVFRDSASGRIAALTKAEAVWLAVSAFPKWDDNWDIHSNAAVASSALTPYQIMTALKYYEEYPEEIDERIRANEEATDQGYAEWLKRKQKTRSSETSRR